MTDAIDTAAEEFIAARVLGQAEAQLARRAFRAGAIAGLRYVVERLHDGAEDGAAVWWLDGMANNIEAGEEP